MSLSDFWPWSPPDWSSLLPDLSRPAGLLFWQKVALLAPIGTGVIAVAAAIIAWNSLRSQRSIARKRAALDLFVKTELDAAMVKANDDFVAGIAQLKAKGGPDKIDKACRTSICNYLNIHKLIAMGIENGVLDDNVCYEFWANELIVGYRDAEELIELIQKEDEQNFFLYHEAGVLFAKWSKRHRDDVEKERERRKREQLKRLARQPAQHQSQPVV